jgi:glycosyltransferase involved in cell wall biosynthesis
VSPRISVITATRNAARHLPALAASLLRHPEDLVEWVVIDSVSTDGTVEFLRGIRDSKLTWISEPDDGIYDAWNKGVDRARGQWLMFLGADDDVSKDWLESCARAPDVDLVFGNLEIHDENGRFLATVETNPWSIVRSEIKTRMMLPHPGLAHSRSLFEGRRFDTSFRISGDFHFLATSAIRSAVRLPITQATMRLGGVSNRPDLVEAAFRENVRVLRAGGVELPLADRLNWFVKRSIARTVPSLYSWSQSARWRLRRTL